MTRLYRIGSLAIDTEAGVIFGASLPAGNNFYMTFESPVGTDYQVPAGKTFYITKILYSVPDAGNAVEIGYGDNGVASGAPAPTNPVSFTFQLKAKEALKLYEVPVFFKVPAEKYPFSKAIGGFSPVHMMGIEV